MSKLRELASRGLQGLVKLKPIQKNRIVFSSYYGRGYSDSPKAICEVLRQSGEDLDLVWLCKDEQEAKTLPAGVRAVSNRGLAHLKALATANVWVDNCRKYENLKRKGQLYLQTWHGFTLKRLEADAPNLEPAYVAAGKRDSAQCDVFISGSRFMTELYKRSFWYQGPVLETGTPRNDVFFADRSGIHERVCKALGLPPERKLALYAPTFRGDRSTDAYCIDPAAVRAAAVEGLKGEWTVLIRLHPNVAAQSAGLFAYDGDTVVDATLWPDMQELLCAADLLITDYSSSMFDYALTGKPVVQFAPDIEAYAKDRNFYFQLDALPFPLASTNEALVETLRTIQPLWTSQRWAEFAREQGFCEDGQASIRCAALILRHVHGEKK